MYRIHEKRTIHRYHYFYGKLFFYSFARILMVIRIKWYDKIMCCLFDLHPKTPAPNDPQGAPWAWIQPFDYHSRGSIFVKPHGRLQKLVLKMFSSKIWHKVSSLGASANWNWLKLLFGKIYPLNTPSAPWACGLEIWNYPKWLRGVLFCEKIPLHYLNHWFTPITRQKLDKIPYFASISPQNGPGDSQEGELKIWKLLKMVNRCPI